MVEALQPTRMSDEDRLIRSIDRGAPGDAAIFSGAKTPEQRALNKRKSAFYSDAFAQRESNSSARERVGRDSVVMAEVRTNVIVSQLPAAVIPNKWIYFYCQRSLLDFKFESNLY